MRKPIRDENQSAVTKARVINKVMNRELHLVTR